MSHVLSVTGREGFTLLLRMERNLKRINHLFLEFSFLIFSGRGKPRIQGFYCTSLILSMLQQGLFV
jgi:hypothetical protein